MSKTLRQSQTSNLMLKYITRFSLLAPLSMGCLVADEGCEQDDCCLYYGGQGDPMNPCAFPAGYGQYGGIELDTCLNILVSGDFIYWSPNRRFRGDIYKFRNNATNDILIFDEVGGYKPGFKVGIGITLPNFDNWTMKAVYTRFHHDYTNTFNTSGTETLTPFTIPLLGVPFTSIRSTTTFNYDDLRLIIARANYISPCIILEPHFALRGIANEYKVNQTLTLLPAFTIPGVVGECTQNANFRIWGADVCCGGHGYMLLAWGFRLVFLGEAGLAYFRATSNDSTVVNNSSIPLGTTVTKTNHFKHNWWVTGTGTAAGGLSWESYFCCQKYHFGLSVLYELETIWGPFQSENAIVFLEGTQYRGLTVHAQFDF